MDSIFSKLIVYIIIIPIKIKRNVCPWDHLKHLGVSQAKVKKNSAMRIDNCSLKQKKIVVQQ